jgi:isocitrate dehydrogenase (NAD+)
MLKYLGESKAADRVEKAVVKVLEEGKYLTRDLGGNTGTVEYAEAVIDAIAKGDK